MGEARRRGTRDERIAKAKERRLNEQLARAKRREVERQALQLADVSPEERKEVVLASDRRSTLALAALLAGSGVYLGGPGWRK